jgi:hypothetical protein
MTTFLPWRGRSVLAGEEIDLPDDVAARYVATGQAEKIEQPKAPVIESAHLDRSQPSAMRDMRAPQNKRR